MSFNIHFLKDPVTIAVLQGILDVAGPNFAPPYDSNFQPSDGVGFSEEDLLQFQLPGGGSLRGMPDPGMTENISSFINSAMAYLAVFIDAYALILPILGVIRGIIEVICALVNPLAVIRAIIRLFSKWIPPFIALFPPFAGIIIVINIIKIIIAIVFFIITVIIPLYELIKENVKLILAATKAGADRSDPAVEAGKQKILDLIAELVQQSGILAVLRPILDLVFSMLGLASGFPCDDKGGDDCPSCALCPPLLSDRSQAPKGSGILYPSKFCDYAPFTVFRLITGNNKIKRINKYIESKEVQLGGCTDEVIRFARPEGADDDTSLVKVKLTTKRGESRSITVPVLDISGRDLKIMSPLARLFVGRVDYQIEIDYEMMVMNNIIGAGCHPDIKDAKDALSAKFDGINQSVLDKFPEVDGVRTGYIKTLNDFNGLIEQLGNVGPPFTEDSLDDLDRLRDGMIGLLSGFGDNMKGILRKVLFGVLDTSATDFEVNKNIVKSDNTDYALITVRPKDTGGSLLLKNLPADIEMDVDFYTNFGTISNQQENRSLGEVTAILTSPITGSAGITATVNGQLLTKFSVDTGDVTKILPVTFKADATLPTRRRR